MSNVHEYLREFESNFYDLYDFAEFLGLDEIELAETHYHLDELIESIPYLEEDY
jgi:hypothetical protein